MAHSTVTAEGQTTIPDEILEAMNIRPGDRLQYAIDGDQFIVRVHPGAASLAGCLKSDKGKDMNFTEIREAAIKVALENGYFDKYR